MRKVFNLLLLFNLVFIFSVLGQEAADQENSFRGFKKGEHVRITVAHEIQNYNEVHKIMTSYRDIQVFVGTVESTGNPRMGQNNFIRILLKQGSSQSFTEKQVDTISGVSE